MSKYDTPTRRRIIRTFGQVAVAGYAECSEEMINDQWIYHGFINTLPQETAKKFMSVSPDFLEYYANALAILWKGANRKHDSENPVIALRSHFPDWVSYIVVWNILKK